MLVIYMWLNYYIKNVSSENHINIFLGETLHYFIQFPQDPTKKILILVHFTDEKTEVK